MQRAWWWSVLLFAAAAACSSEDPAESSDPSTSGGSGGSDNTPVGEELRQQILASCSDFATRLCESAADCCAMSAPDATVEDCSAPFITDVCRPAADAVAAGFASYHEEAVEPCLEAHAGSHAACVADWAELIEIRRAIWSSCKVVQGNSKLGSSCTSSVTCAQPEGAEVAQCIRGTCQKLALLAEGEECAYPNGNVSVCDQGLYCTAEERDEIGECQSATPIGEACEPVLLNQECGLGNYCDLEDAVCRKATNFGGPSCTQATECVSFECDVVTNECAEPLSTVASLCPAGD